jgi:hypothetical protein
VVRFLGQLIMPSVLAHCMFVTNVVGNNTVLKIQQNNSVQHMFLLAIALWNTGMKFQPFRIIYYSVSTMMFLI